MLIGSNGRVWIMVMKPRVVVDEREKASGVPGLLRELGLRIEYRMLNVGDYLVFPECAVERKEERDFSKSLYSGRMFEQAHRLREAYDYPLLIVEGDFPIFIKKMKRPELSGGL